MKSVWTDVAFATAATILLTIIVVLACAKPTPPGPVPPPDPKTEFSLSGKNISVNGKLKPGAVSTVDEAKRSFKIAIDLLESK